MHLNTHELKKLTIPVQDMFMGAKAMPRVLNALRHEEEDRGVKYVGQLLAYTPRDLYSLHNVGCTVCINIIRTLTDNGLRVGALADYKDDLVGIPSLAEMSRQQFGEYMFSIKERVTSAQGFPLVEKLEPQNFKDWLQATMPRPMHYLLSPLFKSSAVTNATLKGRVGLDTPRPVL